MDAGLGLARLVFGLLIAGHGAQKLFGWLGGYGLAGTGGFFEGLGFKPGKLFAGAAGASEFLGGLLLALGLLGPIGPALIVAVMIVAIVTVHWGHGIFAATNGIEVPLMYATVAISLALTGFGAYSLDASLNLARFWTPAVTGIVLGAAVLGAFANLALRRPLVPAVA
jgi:putative oxidoreductase